MDNNQKQSILKPFLFLCPLNSVQTGGARPEAAEVTVAIGDKRYPAVTTPRGRECVHMHLCSLNTTEAGRGRVGQWSWSQLCCSGWESSWEKEHNNGHHDCCECLLCPPRCSGIPWHFCPHQMQAQKWVKQTAAEWQRKVLWIICFFDCQSLSGYSSLRFGTWTILITAISLIKKEHNWKLSVDHLSLFLACSYITSQCFNLQTSNSIQYNSIRRFHISETAMIRCHNGVVKLYFF